MPHHHLHHHHVDRNMGNPVDGNVLPSDMFPLPVPTPTDLGIGLPSLVARAPDSDSTSHSSGEKPTSNLETTVLPVVLGAGVPVLCAIVILIVLHRRHVKKLMREDADDKHRSLDFGLDTVNPQRKQPPGMPQMMEPTHTKGLSLDVHPYLMPPGLHGSRDSLHSLSRSIDDDKYRPATFIPADNMSVRSYPRSRDDASSIAGSTTRFGQSEEPNSGLLRNASRMSRSSPPLHRSPVEESSPHPLAQEETHRDYLGPLPGLPATSFSEHDEHKHEADVGTAATNATAHDRSASPQGPQHHVDMPEPEFNFSSSPDLHFDTPAHSKEAHHEDHLNFPLPNTESSHHEHEPAQTSTMHLPRISLPASDITSSDYGDDHRKSEFVIPEVNVHNAEEAEHQEANKLPNLPEEPQALEQPYDTRRDTRRLTLGVRPLPPEDPADNPEQRANRIRSFYKEYFDESKRETTYYEDYGPEFYDGGYAYDPAAGEYFDAAPPPPMPFAEPMGRRAMTPPPRAPPRFQGAARHMATNSGGWSGYGGPGPRAFSSASNRLPGAGPRRPMPLPAPLQVLPTPHMLKDDSFLVAAEFAPGKNFRDQQSGRPDTPTGGSRPYSPAIRAHTPLMSSFDDLAVIPSAHALRKSGTYTSLDFAPPPRFKNADTGSDAGSIRSNGTGINNTHMNNIRMGNYRVSRLPADMVGTKDDMMSTLKPAWDIGR